MILGSILPSRPWLTEAITMMSNPTSACRPFLPVRAPAGDSPSDIHLKKEIITEAYRGDLRVRFRHRHVRKLLDFLFVER